MFLNGVAFLIGVARVGKLGAETKIWPNDSFKETPEFAFSLAFVSVDCSGLRSSNLMVEVTSNDSLSEISENSHYISQDKKVPIYCGLN